MIEILTICRRNTFLANTFINQKGLDYFVPAMVSSIKFQLMFLSEFDY